jgi:hypothetical protein
LPRFASALVASRFPQRVKPESFGEGRKGALLERVGKQAGAQAQARTGARVLRGYASTQAGRGVAVTASETALFFAKFSKRFK